MNPPAVLGGPPAFPDGLPLVRPLLPDTPRLAADLQHVLDTGKLTNAAKVRQLEEAVAAYLGVGHVVAVSSCTSGLMLALHACGLRGGNVVVPSFTFAATAHAVVWAGGQPTFADVDPSHLTLDPADASTRLEGASAMMAVHLYGTPCDVESLGRVADAAGVPVVYDAAHALGARRRGRPVGRFGIAEVFSLSPTKVVVAGEGGLVATDDGALAEHCRLGRDYGNPGGYDCLFPGMNARMSELHAAVALASLDGLDARITARNALAGRFRQRLDGLPGVSFPSVDEGDVSTFKDLTLLVDRDAFGLDAVALAAALHAEGIETRRYYHPPVHRQKAYVSEGAQPALPVTDRVADQVLTVPLWSHMTEAVVALVADTIHRVQAHSRAVSEVLA